MRTFSPEQIAAAKAHTAHTPPDDIDPKIEALVNDLIGRVADKWTMLILEVLAEHGQMRFTQLGRLVGGISQKMLTQTLRLMERDGLVTRTVHPVVPPKVEYELTDLGLTLGAAFCGVWIWATENIDRIEQARRDFDHKATP
ncbi:MAG TPA: helix-turn-helix domain-containing protein [Rhodopila sp.]|jgi:DNA-binding HxlR family transcriptional regulator|nr:helix-turn-helix domain-containing protein [Rhodopila sp.]